ncbi:Ig-like domain-containing protein [Variovorax sp. PAMC26660]|uniref:Ig-like domain-containing protein n=1 Tax=Variovorax sp. PAMC26660 TaxID=2762322 RepID=UPI0021C2B019|nr:Ig-like domain-containing protein [Variovorax sp. PAMC26660]
MAPDAARAELNSVGNAPRSVHRLKFFVDPALADEIGAAEAGRRLAQYVADVNTVFTRETVRSFVFNPASDLQLIAPASAPPCSHSGLVDGEIAVCVSKSTKGYSHGGLAASWTFPQKGVTWNLNWIAIHDPLRLSRAITAAAPESTEKDYLGRQLKTLLHELEHVFGAGAGEYYNAAMVKDTTGTAPQADLALMSDTDRYWWTRQSWRLDPLLGTVFEQRRDPATNRIITLDMIRFTAGTKANINTDWSDWPKFGTSKYMAGTTATQVRITDRETGAALPGAQVSVWRNAGTSTQQPMVLLVQGNADAAGHFAFDWDCGFTCFNSAKSTLLVKASTPGRAPMASWFTIFDAFEQKAVKGQSTFTIDVALGVVDTTPPTVSLSAPAMATVGQPMTIAPAVVDNVGVWGVKVAGTDGIPICTFDAPPYTCTWTPLAPGMQTIRVIGVDAAGNSAMATANVMVNPPADTTPPTVSVAAPTFTSVSTSTTLSATAQANVGIAQIQFIVDGKTLCTVKAAPYTCNWTPAASGYASVEARAIDAAGNAASVSAQMQVNAHVVPYRALALKSEETNAPGNAQAHAAPPVAAKIRTAAASRDPRS